MRPLSKLAFVATAAIAVGVAGLAAAEIKNQHVLTIRLPDGSQELIDYVGDTPPEVRLMPARWAAFSPLTDRFGPDVPFAALDAISAEMDAEAASLMRQTPSLPGFLFDNGAVLRQVDLGKLPRGMQGYTMVSTLSGAGVCTRTTEYRSDASGGQPKVLTHTSGTCGPDQGAVATPTVTHIGGAGAIPVRWTMT